MKGNLTVAIDVGASLTKAVYDYALEGKNLRHEGIKTMYPVARQLTQASYNSCILADSNSALISFDESYWLVGLAARENAVAINPNQAKYELAIAKCLAIIGQLIMELRGQGVDAVKITVGVLLPLDESGDCDVLQRRLQAALWDFEHNGLTVKCMAEEPVHVSPEGYGISRTVTTPLAGVLILGHRDVSWLHVENGSIVPGKSVTFAGWGMHRMIKQTNFTFKDELRAAHLIFAAESSLKDERALLKLCQPEDLPRLKQALSQSIEQLWLDLSIQLKTCSLVNVDQVIPTGGNAQYWRIYLKQLLGSRLHLGKTLFLEFQERFQELSGSPLLWRMVDVYSFWQTLPNNRAAVAGGRK
jgi:hypothetical protein